MGVELKINTLLDRLCIYSRPVTDHVCQSRGGGGGGGGLRAKTVTYI